MILCITTQAITGPGPKHEFLKTAKRVIMPSTHPWLYMATKSASRFSVYSHDVLNRKERYDSSVAPLLRSA